MHDNPGRTGFHWPTHHRVGVLSAPAWVAHVWANHTPDEKRLRAAYVAQMNRTFGFNLEVEGDPDAAYDTAQYEAWIESQADKARLTENP